LKRIIVETENEKVSVDASNIDADGLQRTESRIEAKKRLRNGQEQDDIIIA
jgi:hypothetical protein